MVVPKSASRRTAPSCRSGGPTRRKLGRIVTALGSKRGRKAARLTHVQWPGAFRSARLILARASLAALLMLAGVFPSTAADGGDLDRYRRAVDAHEPEAITPLAEIYATGEAWPAIRSKPTPWQSWRSIFSRDGRCGSTAGDRTQDAARRPDDARRNLRRPATRLDPPARSRTAEESRRGPGKEVRDILVASPSWPWAPRCSACSFAT